jgi:hypothetical protein
MTGEKSVSPPSLIASERIERLPRGLVGVAIVWALRLAGGGAFSEKRLLRPFGARHDSLSAPRHDRWGSRRAMTPGA